MRNIFEIEFLINRTEWIFSLNYLEIVTCGSRYNASFLIVIAKCQKKIHKKDNLERRFTNTAVFI